MKKLQSLPVPLQKQILLRWGLAGVLFIFGLISAIIWRDASMLVIIAATVFFAVLGVRILWREYIVVTGICVETDVTIIRKRTKAIVLVTEIEGKEARLRIPLRQQFRKYAAGDILDVYVDTAAQIHEWNGEFRLQSYISVDKHAPSCYTNEVK